EERRGESKVSTNHAVNNGIRAGRRPLDSPRPWGVEVCPVILAMVCVSCTPTRLCGSRESVLGTEPSAAGAKKRLNGFEPRHVKDKEARNQENQDRKQDATKLGPPSPRTRIVLVLATTTALQLRACPWPCSG
ncbi:hypothetical protein N5P37_003786, partial [Trichoderma harzianum]